MEFPRPLSPSRPVWSLVIFPESLLLQFHVRFGILMLSMVCDRLRTHCCDFFSVANFAIVYGKEPTRCNLPRQSRNDFMTKSLVTYINLHICTIAILYIHSTDTYIHLVQTLTLPVISRASSGLLSLIHNTVLRRPVPHGFTFV